MTIGAWNGVYLAEVSRCVPPQSVGTATGGITVFTFLGVLVGPAAFSVAVALSGGYDAGFIALGIFTFTAAIIVAWPFQQR